MNELLTIEDVQIVGVADAKRERAENAASRHLAKAYADHNEMIESEKPDAVYVCLPPFAHSGQELDAAKAGLHMFIEKPLTLDLEYAVEVRDAIKKYEVVNAVGYHWRYQYGVDKAKEVLTGKTVGMLMGYWMTDMPEVYWWRRMDQSGGQIVEQATHIFDLARYLCGDIYEVYAAYATRGSQNIQDFDVNDVHTTVIKFRNGVIGNIVATCILDSPYMVGINVIAREFVLEIQGELKIIEPGHTEVFSMGQNSISDENRAFIDTVKTGDKSNIRSNYADAMKTLEVTLACNQSAKTGEPVRIGE